MIVLRIVLIYTGMLCVFAFRIAKSDCPASERWTQLVNHVMETLTIDDIDSCYRACAAKPGCQSINFYRGKSLCELNSRTVENTPDMRVANEDSVYFTIPDPLTPEPALQNCARLYQRGYIRSGIYTINLGGRENFKVYCDQKTAGGGWIVFQRRKDGSVDFYLGWDDYKKGFGYLDGEFWLGLDKIYRLTNQTRNRLRVELEDWEGNSSYAEYDFFAVANEHHKYRLISLGQYSGNAGDSLSLHRDMAFSTKDDDNDNNHTRNCAKEFKGAWWYYNCHFSNLNGLYYQGKHKSLADGVNWYLWKGFYYSAKRAEMKIRPV